jgi:hypothetical protein
MSVGQHQGIERMICNCYCALMIDNGVLGLLELFARLSARRALCAPIGGLSQGPKRKLCEGLVALESSMQVLRLWLTEGVGGRRKELRAKFA